MEELFVALVLSAFGDAAFERVSSRRVRVIVERRGGLICRLVEVPDSEDATRRLVRQLCAE